MYECLGVTFRLHFWQNDRGLLRATAVTRVWKRHRNKSQHKKLTLEKKILPPLLLGFELATLRSRVQRSNQQAIPAPQGTQYYNGTSSLQKQTDSMLPMWSVHQLSKSPFCERESQMFKARMYSKHSIGLLMVLCDQDPTTLLTNSTNMTWNSSHKWQLICFETPLTNDSNMIWISSHKWQTDH